MKRLIIACLTLALAVSGHAQQNIGQTITVHLKDGTKVVYNGGTRMSLSLMGNFETETINNWDDPEKEPTVQKTLQMGKVEFRPLFGYDGETYHLAHQAPGQYSVSVSVDIKGFSGTRLSGACIGTEPNPTWGGESAWLEQLQMSRGDQYMEVCNFGKKPARLSYEEDTWCDYPLELGKTYYLRPFAALYYYPDQEKQAPEDRLYHTTFYGEELNVRVPDSISDHYWIYDENQGKYYYEYNLSPGDTVVTKEAWSAFGEKHPGEVLQAINDNPFYYKSLDELFGEYKDAAVDVSITVRSETYDDGTVYFIEEVPDAFYAYLEAYYQEENTMKEMVYQNLIGYMKTEENSMSEGLYTKNAVTSQIKDVDASWNIPSNSYVSAKPTSNATQCSVVLELPHFVPGKYKIFITMAPETTVENNEENASMFLPSRFRINLFEPADEYKDYPVAATCRFTDAEGSNTFVVPADAVSTIEQEHEFTVSRAIIQIESYVTSRQRSIYSRTLRIAEIRLVPIEE